MDDKLIIKKIQALCHDPAEKAVILGRLAHEGRARKSIGDIIEDDNIPEDVRTADHIASAADRLNIKDKEYVADFLKNPVIKHPLSAREFDLKSLGQIEIESVTETVDRVVGEIVESCASDYEKVYLSLWRLMLEKLRKSGNGDSAMGQLWDLLPADTRVPDHSIWEHKRVTSAIAGALPSPAFLLFTIGPVQDFIATARKTQDLWAGSYVLSYLSWNAMKSVAEEFGPDSLIFPDLCAQPFADKWLKDEKGIDVRPPGNEELSSPTLPNRFLAIVPASSVSNLAESAKKAVQSTFQDICNSVKNLMEERLGLKSGDWNMIWDRQSSEFIETYWAALLIEDVKGLDSFMKKYKSIMGIGDYWQFDDLLKQYEERGFSPNIGTAYGQIYRLTEKTLGSRKSLRNFKQQEEPNHKCTLCGVREPVHPGTYNEQSCSDASGALKKWWQEKVTPEFSQIRKSERLCAICATKRMASISYFKGKLAYEFFTGFPSVSMIATASFKEKIIKNLGNPEIETRLREYLSHIKKLFQGHEDKLTGISLPMIHRMCKNEEAVSQNHMESAREFAAIEGDWLYIDSLQDSLREELMEYSDEILKAVRNSLNALIKSASKLDIDKPSKYYAILLMDGDNMGKWLSGDYAPHIKDVLHSGIALGTEWNELVNQRRPLNPSLHLATSKALRDFSLHVVREIVEKDHLGKLVYAGGDDVLAFVNLRDLPEVMRKLRAYFSGSLKVNKDTGKVDIDFADGEGFVPVDSGGEPLNVGNNKKRIGGFLLSMGTKATASMGVVIAHHNSNLSQILNEVRLCEKRAKDNDKNAFCIALAKRAGGTEHIRAKWYYDVGKEREGGIFESVPLLRQWADAFYHDYISAKMVYSFRQETIGLDGMPHEAVRLELLRIADRQRNKKAAGFDKNKMEELVNGIMILLAGGMSLEDAGKFLSVAAFLGREGNR